VVRTTIAMRGATAYGAVKIKVGACDIEAMSPPMVLMARGGVNPPLSDQVETFLRQRRAVFSVAGAAWSFSAEVRPLSGGSGRSSTTTRCRPLDQKRT
jgi:hypothetical protein